MVAGRGRHWVVTTPDRARWVAGSSRDWLDDARQPESRVKLYALQSGVGDRYRST